MPKGLKRNLSPSQASGSKPKRLRKAVSPAPDPADVIVVDSDNETNESDDLKAILAQIKAQEDDEAMAKRLAAEWAEAESTNIEEGVNDFPMDLSDIEEVYPGAPNGASASTSSISKGKGSLAKTLTGIMDSSDSQGNRSYISVPITPDEGLTPFREMFTKTRPCSKCGKNIQSSRGCVSNSFPIYVSLTRVFATQQVIFSSSLLPPTLLLLLHAPCTECRTNHCRGCFKPISCRATCKGPSKNNDCSIMQCCAEMRAIAVFEVLGSFDRQFLGERAKAHSRALAALARNNSAHKRNTVGPGGTGYGTGTGGSKSKTPKSSATKSKDNVVASRWDKIVVHAFATLTELLPAPYSDDPQVYDILPHASIGYLLSLSQLPVILADLLRNDSVTDWISRKEIYNAMLSLLRRMADNELTIQCLIGQRWEMDKSCDLECWMWEDGEITWTKNSKGDLEVVPPLYSYFKKLTKQSEAFQGGAMQMLGEAGEDGDDVDDTMIQGTSLCGDIIAARDALERAITLLGLSSGNLDSDSQAPQVNHSNQLSKKGKGKDTSINIDKVYVDTCERLAFKHVSLWEVSSNGDTGLNYTNYNYASQLTSTENATRLPKSRLHLVKELAVTATSLPAGVWVRVDEVRNDAMCVLLTSTY